MRMRYLLPFLISILLISCSDKKGDFSVKAPEGWVRIDTVSIGKDLYVQMHKRVNDTVPRFTENINISIEHFFSLDAYVSSIVSMAKSNAEYFEERGSGNTEVSSYKAKWIQHIIKLKTSRTFVEQKIFFIKDHGNIYMIVCSAKANKIGDIKDEIDEVLHSFKIL